MGRKHVHKYQRQDIGRKNGPNDRKKFIVFKCVLPDCTHYVEYALVKGKFCLCNRCNKLMVMTWAAMQMAKPHCPDCTKRKVKLPDLGDLLKDKGIE